MDGRVGQNPGGYAESIGSHYTCVAVISSRSGFRVPHDASAVKRRRLRESQAALCEQDGIFLHGNAIETLSLPVDNISEIFKVAAFRVPGTVFIACFPPSISLSSPIFRVDRS